VAASTSGELLLQLGPPDRHPGGEGSSSNKQAQVHSPGPGPGPPLLGWASGGAGGIGSARADRPRCSSCSPTRLPRSAPGQGTPAKKAHVWGHGQDGEEGVVLRHRADPPPGATGRSICRPPPIRTRRCGQLRAIPPAGGTLQGPQQRSNWAFGPAPRKPPAPHKAGGSWAAIRRSRRGKPPKGRRQPQPPAWKGPWAGGGRALGDRDGPGRFPSLPQAASRNQQGSVISGGCLRLGSRGHKPLQPAKGCRREQQATGAVFKPAGGPGRYSAGIQQQPKSGQRAAGSVLGAAPDLLARQQIFFKVVGRKKLPPGRPGAAKS